MGYLDNSIVIFPDDPLDLCNLSSEELFPPVYLVKSERISPATGSEFALLQSDNATGNFVKIAQRIPVRVSVDPDQPQAQRLRPGMSVVVSIDTRVVSEEDRKGG